MKQVLQRVVLAHVFKNIESVCPFSVMVVFIFGMWQPYLIFVQ